MEKLTLYKDVSYYDQWEEWLNSLDKKSQENSIYLMEYTFPLCVAEKERQSGRSFFSYFAIQNSAGNIIECQNELICIVSHELTKTKLFIDWNSLGDYTDHFLGYINNQKYKGDRCNMCFSKNEFTQFFWSIFSYSKNIDALLSYPIDFNIKPEDNRLYIPEIDEMIEFIGMYWNMMELYIDRGVMILEDIEDKRTEKRTPTFKELFRDKDNAQKVKDILERNEYTIKGEWRGLSRRRSELSCLYYSLQPLLINGSATSQGRIISNEFKLTYGQTQERTMRTPLFNQDREEFDRIFTHLIPK